jgi:hypothetical protein
MLKRVLLGLTFVAALGAAGLGMTSSAQADHRCGYGGYGYRTAYYPSYHSYYGGYDYGPRVSYYRSYGHRGYHGHHRQHYHHGHRDHDRGRVSFSIGF